VTATATPPRRQRSSWKFVLRPGWIAAILGAIFFAIGCWWILAPWQFGRHDDRDAQNSAIATALASPEVPVTDLLSTTAEPTGEWRLVTATGTFLPQGQVFVRLRQDSQGNPASEVLVPFRLTDGTLLLVDRGYMPDDQARAGVAPAALPTGTVTVTGRVQQDQADPSHRAPVQEAGHTLVYGIEAEPRLTPFAAGAPVLQGFIQLETGSPAVLTEIGVPQTDSGPFLSYALQWCAFGAIALLTIGYFVYREFSDPREDEKAEVEAYFNPDSAELPAEVPTARRLRGGFDKSQLYDQD
jgi:cytochrome oxidase assembly protein ShyY1